MTRYSFKSLYYFLYITFCILSISLCDSHREKLIHIKDDTLVFLKVALKSLSILPLVFYYFFMRSGTIEKESIEKKRHK